MGESDMYRNMDNDVERENEKYSKRRADLNRQRSQEEEEDLLYQRSGRTSQRKSCWQFTGKGEAPFTAVVSSSSEETEECRPVQGCFEAGKDTVRASLS